MLTLVLVNSIDKQRT